MAEKKPIEIEDIPWESPPPGEVSWWNPSNLPGMKGELRERQDPLAPLPDALGKKRGEPVSAGLSAWQEQIDAINRDIGRDKPVFIQYLLYLNDISPLSIYETKNTEGAFFLDNRKYTSVVKFFPVSLKLC